METRSGAQLRKEPLSELNSVVPNTVSYQNSSEGYTAKKIHRYPEEHSKCLKGKQAFHRQAVYTHICIHVYVLHHKVSEGQQQMKEGPMYRLFQFEHLPEAFLPAGSETWQSV